MIPKRCNQWVYADNNADVLGLLLIYPIVTLRGHFCTCPGVAQNKIRGPSGLE